MASFFASFTEWKASNHAWLDIRKNLATTLSNPMFRKAPQNERSSVSEEMCCQDRKIVPSKRVREVDEITGECPQRKRTCIKDAKSTRRIKFAKEPSVQQFLRHKDFCKSDMWYSVSDISCMGLPHITH